MSKNAVNNFIPNMQSIIPKFNMSNIIPNNALATNTGNNINYNLTLNIDNVTGDKQGGQTVFKEIVNGLKKLGK